MCKLYNILKIYNILNSPKIFFNTLGLAKLIIIISFQNIVNKVDYKR
jgi:hypothetical protein